MSDRDKALELALDYLDRKAQGWEDVADIARALLQEAERNERLSAVLRKVPEVARYTLATLPIQPDERTGRDWGIVHLGRSLSAQRQLGVLMQDSDALTNGEHDTAALKEPTNGE